MKAKEEPSTGGGGCCSGRSKKSKLSKDELNLKKQLGGKSTDLFNGP